MLTRQLDLEADRQVTVEEALELAEAENLAYMETSAKDDSGIDEAFDCVLKGLCPPRVRHTRTPAHLQHPHHDAHFYSL